MSSSILPSMLGEHMFLECRSWGGQWGGGEESCLSRLRYLLRLLTPALPGALTRQGFRQCLLQAELNTVLGTMQYLEVRDLG